jgi:hypothetical protein
VNQNTGERISATNGVVLQYLLYKHTTTVALFILVLVMALVIWGFFGYHLSLVARGMTTNESFKWASVKHAHKQMCQQYHAAQEELVRLLKEEAEAGRAAGGKVQNDAGADADAELDRWVAGAVADADADADTDAGTTTALAGAPGGMVALFRQEHKDILSVEPHELLPLVNPYHLGFLTNLWEVVHPRCDRKQRGGFPTERAAQKKKGTGPAVEGAAAAARGGQEEEGGGAAGAGEGAPTKQKKKKPASKKGGAAKGKKNQ